MKPLNRLSKTSSFLLALGILLFPQTSRAEGPPASLAWLFLLVFLFLFLIALMVTLMPVFYFLFRGFKTRGKFDRCSPEQMLPSQRAFWLSLRRCLFPGSLYFILNGLSTLVFILIVTVAVPQKQDGGTLAWIMIVAVILLNTLVWQFLFYKQSSKRFEKEGAK